ncbi:subunit delta of clathrin/coatomer adaptor AP-3 complex [Chloropicon primus]|uniref:AP-3 complex subunit delta n=2 Tax=Chloropicon primus TaxID=1764295 RepID=A0A5B8N2S8_9CHLO|nr:subunit delta of clathrin/coatomer adaptor AP-3 complex [Chloropicon primus]UPR05185.1 subunit delta of clathrin/coatomer adaptor AP-3 complex [Chloropicon primus]|eukprot:QDZ25984.1 subunit delta of clathrin/coatomer adaptor AP-3 complex [Chloropicon primus]
MGISLFQKSLRDMISGMRSNRNNEEKYIQKSMEDIKKELKSTDMKVKTVALQKLTYLNMLGFDMSWAAFHVVEVMSTPKLLHKVVGYQAAAQSFNEGTDVMLLITNLLKKDLISTNPTERSIGLDCLSNIVTLDLARDLIADVYGLLSSSSAPCRKRSALVLYCCFLKYPDALRPCFKGLVEHLDDHEQSVVCSVVSVLCELVIKHPHNYLEMAPLFYRLLLNSTNNWMTMKLLKIFGALTPLEPRLTKKIVEPLKNIMSSTMAKSLLFDCITTVCSGMTSNEEIVEMALGHLKDFVLDSDPNLKYLGFKALEQFVKHIPETVLRFGNAALMCLSTADPTIRSSALRVISGLVSKKDLKEVIVRVLEHIPSADTAYRNELSEVVLSICCRDKYSLVSDFSWYLNILVELARVPGSVHGKTIAFQITDIACRVEAMRDDAVQAVRSLLIDPFVVEMGKSGSIGEVLKATAWITGEYASFVEHPKETIEALLQPGILKLPCSVQAMYIQAILKVFVHITNDLVCDDDADEASQSEKDGSTWVEGEDDAEEDNGDEELDKLGVVNELSDLILAHVDQYSDTPDPEVVERMSQLKAVLDLQKGMDDIKDVKDLFSKLHGIISEELQPISGKAQKKVPLPEDLQVIDPIMEEFFDEEFDLQQAEEDVEVADNQAASVTSSRGMDAAQALTEATEEQKKFADETAKNQLKQHREKHGVFYLSSDDKQGAGDMGEDDGGEVENVSVQEPPVDVSEDSATKVDALTSYRRKKKKKKKQPTDLVVKQDEDVNEGVDSPVKINKNALDVNPLAPLEDGEELPSVEAYPTSYSNEGDMPTYETSYEPVHSQNTEAPPAEKQKHKSRRRRKHKSRKEKEGAPQEATAAET